MSVILRAIAWLAVTTVLIVTIGPPGLRPHIWAANAERFAAFLVFGGLFALAYPRRWAATACLVLFTAALLELAQAMVPHRHPTMKDFVIKAIGGEIGVTSGLLLHLLVHRFGQQVDAKSPSGSLD